MTANRKAPGQARALKLLKRLVAQRSATGDIRLPRMHELAQQAGVAYVTMVKAVGRLKAAGAVTARPRRGLVAVAAIPDLVLGKSPGIRKLPRPADKWEEISALLRKDVFGGAFPENAVFSAKELGRRYDVCYETLRKALAPLLQNRIAQHARKGYRFPLSRHRHPGAEIVLLARGDGSGNISFPSVRSQWQVRTLESVCSGAGVRLRPLAVDHAGAVFDRRSTVDLLGRGMQGCLGFSVWSMAIPSGPLLSVIRRLAKMGKPISIFDEAGNVPLLRFLRRDARILPLSMATSESAGRVAGQYLIGLGHRHVAFLSYASHETDIAASNRMNGMQSAFTEAGFGKSVDGFSLATQSDYGAIQERAAVMGTRIVDVVRSYASRPETAILTPAQSGMISSTMESLIRWEAMHGDLVRMLQQVVNHTHYTAWVCYNDELALHCLDFLRSAGVRVPGDVSLMGFDDSLEGFSHGLTSLNFNAAAYMRAIVGFIIDPANALYRTGPGRPMEIEGTVVARETTGKAGKGLNPR